MNCWHCNHELIWGADVDVEDDEGNDMLETNLSCPDCDAFVLVYLPRKNEGEKK
tara:strand:+ start:426 stop:587 length:162 start_codon:yes stop_codon:yes gene_type:complete